MQKTESQPRRDTHGTKSKDTENCRTATATRDAIRYYRNSRWFHALCDAHNTRIREFTVYEPRQENVRERKGEREGEQRMEMHKH
ncbi:hypothetical protein KQX54_021375 [Cotesia glomerata]|uniref:Uncharacterized protein n=1 Tax=Cotesia glomerata TaxID=32391 RepID=A0AAV7J6P3_COTGL|nr:hypothetical protein KQX54_021375 [Cotesia glomerata]